MSRKTFSLLVILLVLVYGLVKASPAMAIWYVDGQGNLIDWFSGQVLGDDDEHEEEDEHEEDEEEEHKEEKHEEDEVKTEAEYFDSAQGAYVKTKTEAGKTKTEIKYLTGEEVKVETEDGEAEIEYEGDDDNKMKLKNENGIIKIESEGKEMDLGDELVMMEREDKHQIRISTASGKTMKFMRNNRAAKTDLPISIDLDTNELVITTAKGSKTVTVLPDQAVANMLAANVFDRVKDKDDEIDDSVELVEIEDEDGELVYEIQGVSDQKLLGLVPVTVETTAVVSATTGELVETQKTLANNLIDLVSF